MSLDYPNRADWLAKRYTPLVNLPVRFVWDSGNRGTCRKNVNRTLSSKAGRRRDKKARMAAMYRGFFDHPGMQQQIAAHRLLWCVDLHPRLVRDTVLGSRNVG